MIYSYIGRIIYENRWCFVDCPKDIALYYQFVLNREFGIKINLPRNGPHITVIAGKYEDVSHLPNWRNDECLKIEIKYSILRNNGEYWWLKIENQNDLSKIRRQYDLSDTPKWPFHLTIGNTKQK